MTAFERHGARQGDKQENTGGNYTMNAMKRLYPVDTGGSPFETTPKPEPEAEKVEDEKPEIKTISEDEFKARLERERTKHQKEMDELKKEIDNAKLSEEERKTKEQEELLAELEALRQEKILRQVEGQAVDKLSELGLPTTKGVLEFVVNADEEVTEANINKFANILETYKKEVLNELNASATGSSIKPSTVSAASSPIDNFLNNL